MPFNQLLVDVDGFIGEGVKSGLGGGGEGDEKREEEKLLWELGQINNSARDSGGSSSLASPLFAFRSENEEENKGTGAGAEEIEFELGEGGEGISFKIFLSLAPLVFLSYFYFLHIR